MLSCLFVILVFAVGLWGFVDALADPTGSIAADRRRRNARRRELARNAKRRDQVRAPYRNRKGA